MTENTAGLGAKLLAERSEYDTAANTYMDVTRAQVPFIDQEIRDEFIMSVRFNHLINSYFDPSHFKGANVLCCGCGQAFYEIALANRGANVLAYDISEGMLDIARHNAKIHGADIRFFRSDEGQLSQDLKGFGIDKIDFVFGAAILHHMVDQQLWLDCIKPYLHSSSSALFFEPVSSYLVDRMRASSLNPQSSEHTEGERVWTLQEYRALLGQAFPKVQAVGNLNVFSAAQKIVRGKLPQNLTTIDNMSRLAYRLDRMLANVPPMQMFNWHTALICKTDRYATR